MLVSESEERGRKFKLALRAGLPVLLLISLVAYGTFWQGETFVFGLREAIMVAALVFVTTYFIFFLLEEDSQKTLIDPTTNSYNYAAFLQQYTKKKPQAMALIFLDNLPTISENYGGQDVDAMLRSLIYQLDATLAAHGVSQAVIGRKYGAEFLISADADEVTLQSAIQTFVQDHPSIQEIEIDFRFGTISEPTEALNIVVGRLHDTITTKLAGSSARSSRKKAPIPKARELKELEEHIIRAIEDERLSFMLRPLYHVQKQRSDIYELSARLKLSDGQEVLPRIYLPIVNRLGLGRDYDMAIFKHVLSLLPLVDPSVSFSFNLSPFSLRNSEFQAELFRRLAESTIAPSRLIIELYERKTHHNLESYLKTLEAFRARGLRICIDNFGSSNASMEYMRHFKFDMVQFDRDYVGHMDDQNSNAMLQSLIAMSQSLHILTVAKWVDKEAQKQKLIAMGIDYLQGFGIAKPISESELIEKYNKGMS